MFYKERQDRILTLLGQERSMSVHKLARELCISESSIRRDLAVLEEMGKIKRTFGGAVLYEAQEREVSLLYRTKQHMREKAEIAQKAAACLRDGMTLFLDASSSAAQLLPHLERFQDLTVITNSPATSMRLGERGVRNYCTGGLLLHHSIAYVGNSAEAFVGRFTADVLFFSCRGFSEDGVLSDSMEEEVLIRQAMLSHARKRVFLCDRSKYGLSFPYRLCTREDVDIILTEDK